MSFRERNNNVNLTKEQRIRDSVLCSNTQTIIRYSDKFMVRIK